MNEIRGRQLGKNGTTVSCLRSNTANPSLEMSMKMTEYVDSIDFIISRK
ncbi:MAG: hypothetical protein H9802_02275 [Candidatus Phocaeicola faecipullorum]|nr:hypothetical protein [Candidatus Phocaeicola faecipullorum]